MTTIDENPKRVYPYIILWIILSFPLAIFFADILGAYWGYWDMTWAGDVFYLLLCVFPLMLLLFLGVGSATSVFMWTRNYDGWKIFLLSISNMLATFVICFTFNVLQRLDYPTSKTGSLFEFLIQYIFKWIKIIVKLYVS